LHSDKEVKQHTEFYARPQKEYLLFKSILAALVIVASALTIFLTSEPVSASSQISCTSWYTVKSGDYLSRITSDWQNVARLNGISNPNLIYPGQRICLSGSGYTAVSYSSPAVSYSAKRANGYPYGQCTWGAEELATRNLNGLGNAKDWDNNARARGIPVGYVPRVGSTVVFEPGVQYANSTYGHVAHVVALGSNGNFQIREMNNSYYGGWGIYNYRWVYVSAGVSFIY
jgi:surface antigen